MKRKKILGLLCLLLAGVCAIGIVETQIQVHGQRANEESAAAYSIEEVPMTDELKEQEINYESAIVYYPNETKITDTPMHTYTPSP